MVLRTLFALSVGLLGQCNCSLLPTEPSPTFSGDNAIVLCLLGAIATVSLVGACAICFRRKKTFEKLENESGTAENVKKNEYPIFRALATEGNESAAIVPCDRTNASRDNLLNSSDNLATDEGSPRRNDVVDSSEVVLIEKSLSPPERARAQTAACRDTITYETEKDIKKQASPPSSSTPLLYANNVQSYQHNQPINEQMQQKSASVQLAAGSPFKDFYDENAVKEEERLNIVVIDNSREDFMTISISEETKEDSVADSMNTNPFFDSAHGNSVIENQASKDIAKDDASEIESSNNSEKYQILDEETDGEDGKVEQWEEVPSVLQRQGSKVSLNSIGDNNSIEEALRALDIAIGGEDDEEDSEDDREEEAAAKLDEIKEEANFLVDSIVNDCEKILEEKALDEISPKQTDISFEEFDSLNGENMSTPCAAIKSRHVELASFDAAKALFPDGVDISDINGETFAVDDQTFDCLPASDKTFDAPTRNLPEIKIDKEEVSSEDMTTVTPVNTPIEMSYSSETWDKMTYSKGAVSKPPSEPLNKTVTLESENDSITFNQDGWYLHPQAKNDTFDVCDEEEEEGNMDSTYDQLRRQLTEMLPHAQGMSQHNDFLDDDDPNKDSCSPSENYGIKYGELDEATNAGSFDMLEAIINPEPVATNEMHINYKRPLSPILEESECDETCRTFVFNNETKLLDSTSTGIMESASAEAQMGQMPKTLMASNDTLFNFEDTLSDQADNLLMSPRMNTAGSSGASTLSRQESHDKISLERTPTNEELPKIGNDTFARSQELDAIDIMKNSIRQYPLNLDLNSPIPSTSKYEIAVAKLALEDGSWPLELPEAQQSVNDLSSPEQPKTGDSLSFEQDVTYTIDDQKTCISFVLKNDDERISEISEPIFASESLDLLDDNYDNDDRMNSLQIEDLMTDVDDNFNFELNDENGNQEMETKEMELTLKVEEVGSAIFDNDSINPPDSEEPSKKEFEIDSLEPENKLLDDDVEADSIQNDSTVQSDKYSDSDSAVIVTTENSSENSDGREKTKHWRSLEEAKLAPATDKDILLNKAEIAFHELHKAKLTTFDFFKTLTDMHEKLHQCDDHCGNLTEFSHDKYLDGSWGSSTDIRQVSCNQGMMSTSFSKEWSDDDSSHSSEEFMYVKGEADGAGAKSVDAVKEDEEDEKPQEGKPENKNSSNEKSSENIEIVDVELDEVYSNWNKRQTDQIPATPIFHGDEHPHAIESEDESAEEGEFVPSCWDQSLQPKRSSLKSPEREHSEELQKRPRRVAFKTQRYHSVYEYPCEVVQLSPALSEPKLWSNYLDDASGNIDYFTYTRQISDLASDFPQTLDGFNISSSSRPFHSANSVQLHNTWPNDSAEFSWSQIQDEIEEAATVPKQHQFPLKIDWPSRKSLGFDDDDSDERPDSGVGESSDSPLMGELCHHKGSLRLPLELVSSTSSEVSDFVSDTKEHEAVDACNEEDECLKQPKNNLDVEDDESDKMILPTPSFSGSMDSLSSNSGSSSSRGPPSFTTFGKDVVLKDIDVSGRTSIIFIEDEVESTQVEQEKHVDDTIEKDEKFVLSNKLVLTVGSSDEDSGFENITRMGVK